MNITGSVILPTIWFALENINLTHTPHQPVTTVSETEKCYGIYGCYSIEYPWISKDRMVAYFPASPEELNLRFPTFTRHNMKIPYFLDSNQPEKIRMRNFDRRGPFFLISHGYLAGGDKPWIQEMMKRLLSLRENMNATVIVVDWREASSPPYSKAVGNSRLLGTMTAHLINDLYVNLNLKNLDNFHFIGHSLGAHIAGYAGATLQKKFGLKLGRITGMDPAEPHFQQRINEIRLDTSDAKFVDVIHTDATLFISGGLGIFDSIGHVDFFPNGGRDQPGCDKTMIGYINEDDSFYGGLEKLLSCSHGKSHDYFIESITSPCPFLAITCSSYEHFKNGSCFQCGANGQSCLRFGYHSIHGYRRMMQNGLVKGNKPINAYLMTGSPGHYCQLHHRLTINMTTLDLSAEHFGDTGRLGIVFIDKNGSYSERMPLDEQAEPQKQGTQKTLVVTSKDISTPEAVLIDFQHVKSLLNPLTWRVAASPRVYISWIHIESLEYKTSITVCPPNKTFVGTDTPVIFMQKYCVDIFPIKIPPRISSYV